MGAQAGGRSWTVRSAEDLGRAVAGVRGVRGLTQTEVAKLAMLDRSWLAKIERGRSNRLLEDVLQVLRRLGASVTITVDDPKGVSEGVVQADAALSGLLEELAGGETTDDLWPPGGGDI